MSDENEDLDPESDDEALLKELREDHAYLTDMWSDAQENRATNMRYLMGDPWDPDDRKEREDAGRPVISHDELMQYVNQAVNQARLNKRGIKIDPDGEEATDDTAALHQDIIRTAEYKSNAQNARITSYEHAIQGGYGFRKITHAYRPGSWDQEIQIKSIVNPDSILFDWDCKEPDWSDARKCFELELMPIKEFKRRFPKAEIKDFTSEHYEIAPKWFSGDRKQVLIASAWYIRSEWKTFYQWPDGSSGYEKIEGLEPENEREEEVKHLVRYITNGVEKLGKEDHPGENIPIIPCVGQEFYVDEGSGAKRKLRGVIDLAREPQMSMAYAVSQELEEMGQSPRAPVRGWAGQFETDADNHANANKQPVSYLQYDYPDWALDRGITVALPARDQFVPNFQQYEIVKESCRRAIQAAMGISPLPTSAQRQNEKSGVALERMQQAEQVGSFHFPDNYDRSLQLEGRIIESWLSEIYDNERKMHLRKADDSTKLVTLNTEQPYADQEAGRQVHYQVDKGEHFPTVSTGPAYASVQQEFKELLMNFSAHPEGIPQPGTIQAKIMALSVKAMNLGIKGDEIADLFSPDEKDQNIPPQVQQALQQMQQQMQALNEYAKQKEAEIDELKQKMDARVIDNEYKAREGDKDREVKLAIAEVTTKAQNVSERLAFVEDLIKQLGVQQHEKEMTTAQQSHESSMADQNAQIAAQQQEMAPQQEGM
jgi:hypothetical protein